MKTKRFTPTTAKLPENEMMIGGDASPKLFKKSNLKQIDSDYQNHLRKHGKK